MTIDKALRRKAIARWHRRFAIFISLWLIALASSGLLINHAHDWGLDRQPLTGSLQHWVYGIEPHGSELCGPLTSEGIACDGVFASLQLPMGSLLLGARDLFLLDDAGQLIEKLSVSQFGLSSLQAGLRVGSEIYLRDTHKTIQINQDLMDSSSLDTEAIAALMGHDWQVAEGTQNAITWERFLLDLHAARFLGPLAKVFNDLMAALILVLALSGIWLYRIKPGSNGNGTSQY